MVPFSSTSNFDGDFSTGLTISLGYLSAWPECPNPNSSTNKKADLKVGLSAI
jgi:hypothetical protein